NTLVASTIRSRNLLSFRNRPVILSLSPLVYTLAVSKKLSPASTAFCMIAQASLSLVDPPKFIVPRHNGETITPERPSLRYSMEHILSVIQMIEVDCDTHRIPFFLHFQQSISSSGSGSSWRQYGEDFCPLITANPRE